MYKIYELHSWQIEEINEMIGEEFRKSNDNYAEIQRKIEEKFGEGALMLAFRQTKATLLHAQTPPFRG